MIDYNIGKSAQVNTRLGSPRFYKLLEEMADTHDRKSHDYASNDKPYANYEFAGWLCNLFKHSELDMGFISRIGEKLYRLSNLEGKGLNPKNESIEDTERDLCVIMALWMSARRDNRGVFSQAVAGGLNPEYQEETAAPGIDNADRLMSILIYLEPLMDKNTLAQATSYLRECETARGRIPTKP